jgi:demethylspheroidene O-methyltransferase
MRKPSDLRQNILSTKSLNRAHGSQDSIADRFKNFRAKLLASPKFQKFCAGFWPTKFVARSKAAEVFDLCNGFVYSQVLFACVRLNLLQTLQENARTIEGIAAFSNLPFEGARRLVMAATSLDILETRSGERYGLGEAGAAILGNPGLQGMILHHEHFYKDLQNPVALLSARTDNTALSNYWYYSAKKDHDDAERAVMTTYSDLMSETQTVLADEVLRAYRFDQHLHLMDVGGGDGAFLRKAHASAPNLQLSLLDLPTVVELAGQRLQADGIPVSARAGNMFEDDWPDQADLITLIRVALDHDDEKVEILLRRARAALKPGGVLLLAEPMTDSPKVGFAYFGFYLWAMGSGRARSSDELRGMLHRAGFTETAMLQTGLPDIVRVIRAT